MVTIRCTKCGEAKHPEEFPKQSSSPSGLHSHCKECRRAYSRTMRQPAYRVERGFNPYRIVGDVVELTLSAGPGKTSISLVSLPDLPRLIEFGHRWSVDSKGYGRTYGRVNYKTWAQALHRFLLDPPADMEIDHINGNRLDNRRENLRIVTRQENMRAMHARLEPTREEAKSERLAKRKAEVQARKDFHLSRRPCERCGKPYWPLRKGFCASCAGWRYRQAKRAVSK